LFLQYVLSLGILVVNSKDLEARNFKTSV
jgi:hypothetical protein